MSVYTLSGGRLVDPATCRAVLTNIVVADGRIREVGKEVAGERVDVGGLVVAPGFVDPHVHLREPGAEDSETVSSGTQAAAVGGYTAVFAMANTDPVPDDPKRVGWLRRRARQAWCDVEPVAAITHDLAGDRLVDLEAMAASGVRYASDDGRPVPSARVMRDALRSAATHGIVIGNHAEEPSLTENAQANEGVASHALGKAGWPHEAEEVMVARDLLLAHGLDARLHIPHVSTAAAVDVIRWAKARGVRVTAEATPHHLTLVDEVVRTRDTSFKVNPPLRGHDDVRALREALRDGTIDMVATDHAPHSPARKLHDWDEAPCGMLGVETAFAMLHTRLVQEQGWPLSRLIDAMSTQPARAFGLHAHGGPVVPDQPANLVVLDLDERWIVKADDMRSLSRNTPFEGADVQGRVVHTIRGGRFTVRDRTLVA